MVSFSHYYNPSGLFSFKQGKQNEMWMHVEINKQNVRKKRFREQKENVGKKKID